MKNLLPLVLTALFVSGCASPMVRHAVPMELVNKAQIPGMENIRVLSNEPSDVFLNDFVKILEQEQKEGFFFFDLKTDKTYPVLAISGGAANGAYGAGLLNGWSQSGSRPVFKIVTGISTGAIIAPFAFLGSDYDEQLKEIYTRYSTRDIVLRRSLIKAITGNSFASSKPLEKIFERIFDEQLIKRIAEEYAKGRRLYVGTTNLDAQRLTIWDMGKIASIGDDRALKLFRKVILASSTIPGAFPPVYFDVEAGAKHYDEMHVDGGTTKQVFFLYDVLQGFEEALKEKKIDVARIKYKIYVIRNGYIDPVWKEVPDKLLSIAERAIDTMTNAQGLGDIYQLYDFTRMDKGDFNLAYISSEHVSQAKEPFDRVEMRRLFDLGFEEAAQGYRWKKSPMGADNK
jgi:hypothetical protein